MLLAVINIYSTSKISSDIKKILVMWRSDNAFSKPQSNMYATFCNYSNCTLFILQQFCYMNFQTISSLEKQDREMQEKRRVSKKISTGRQ